jgi:superfamily I DNA/RNA helicase
MADSKHDPSDSAFDMTSLRELLRGDKALLQEVRKQSTTQLRSGVTARMTSDITGNPEAASRFNRFKSEEERALLKISDEPFFARVDTSVTTGSAASEKLTFLVTTARMNCRVDSDEWQLISWTNPLSQRLLDKRLGDTEVYLSPRGRRTTYEVGPSSRYEGEIAPIATRVTVALPSGTAYILDEQEFFSRDIVVPPAAPLPRAYEPTPAFGLGDIIVTADEPQRAAMLLPFADSVLIEGPPGSGKTSIGIMRIACLVDQQWEELELRKGVDKPFHEYQWMRVLVFTEEMVEYLKQLVASIGVERVPVQTTKKFMQEICRTAGTLSGRELVDLPSASAVKGQRETLAAYWAGFRVHLAHVWEEQRESMTAALHRIDPRGAEIIKILAEWVTRVQTVELHGNRLSLPVRLSGPLDRWARSLRDAVPELSEVPSMPTASMSRAQAKARVGERAQVVEENERIRQLRQATEISIKEAEKLVRSFVQSAVDREKIVNRMFGLSEFAEVLKAAHASGMQPDRVDAGERQWKRQYDEVVNPGYSEYDLAVATWLGNQILLVPDQGQKPFIGGTLPRLTHLVVDEVQDLSPCHIATLKSLMDEEGTMTVVGDLRQNLHPSGGLVRWEELQLDHLKLCRFGINYRQTRELGEFVQHLHQSLLNTPAGWDTSSVLTGPLARLGRTRSWRTAASAVADEIRHWRSITPKATVAVLYDAELEPRELEQLQDRLASALQDQILTVHAVNPAARGSQLRESDCVLIASVRQTKGLEFDAVIVVDLRDDWAEASSVVDPRVRNGLYVAASRARNGLTLCMRVIPDWMESISAAGAIERVQWAVAATDSEE